MNQMGRGLPAFAGTKVQRGHGLGGILRGLVKVAMPVLKQGAKKLGKSALKTGIDVAAEVARGKTVKEAVKEKIGGQRGRPRKTAKPAKRGRPKKVQKKGVPPKRVSLQKGTVVKRFKDIFDR